MTESPEQQPAAAPGRISRLLARITPLPLCAVLGAACGVSYGVLKAPEYAATSYVVAVPAQNAEPGSALGYAQAYGRIATSDSTIAYARGAAGVPDTHTLRTHVQTETSPDSPMIAITGTSTKPRQAAHIANAVANAVYVSSNHISKNTGVKLLVFSPAITPTEPASPSVPIGAAVGTCAGGLIGGLVLLVRPRRTHRARGTAPASVPAPAQGQDQHHAHNNASSSERELV
ncbi:lipopolysaccharide biosynthesis protein [Streptomyces sp. ISL-98]|uniref:lipopolysaccharide biosynthesis protein n=1 Tax=Streptomyces sp. ISL-98 TaxID=2819192 RepID=UPI001BE8523E|nr:lipopolysaccharide biosynthesis protein [Streptomyces sp. ISL-98]MBT2507280.1 lipopolysaccharide biosynthesis protein [Streptomyces sp. ISL-98]